MDNSGYEQELIYYDILINFYMNNPALYDKMDEQYACTIEKIDKLKELSMYLKELQIEKTVPDIMRTWQSLVNQFKKCLADENKARSGSAATENNFPYYENLMFLKGALQQRKVLSTINLSSNQTVSPNWTFQDGEKKRKVSSTSTFYAEPSKITSTGHASSCVPPLHHASVAGSSFSSHSSLKVPEYDKYAQKKIKFMVETDENIKLIGQKIIQTLDCVNSRAFSAPETLNAKKKSIENDTIVASDSTVQYRTHLAAALNTILPGYENQCMEYVIEKLEIFDQQLNKQDEH